MSSVDVIVPCYRYAHFLRESVTSVLSQTGCEVRVLIIDDASPDDTPAVAAALSRADSRVSVRRHDTNIGHIETYNEGLEWASANYLLLLSADDYLLPGALGRATTLMDARAEVGFSFGRALRVAGSHAHAAMDGSAAAPDASARILSGYEFIRSSASGNLVPTPTAVVRTALQKVVGGYDPRLPHSGDMHMWLRLASHAPVAQFLQYQAVHRLHDDNMSNAYYANNCLPDLLHRKAAIEDFFRRCGHRVSHAQRVQRTMLKLLACESIGHASSAFNTGNDELCGQLVQFAIDTSRNVTKSVPWAKFACKRLLGPSRWNAVQALRWKRSERSSTRPSS